MATPKQQNALVTYFITKYKERYGVNPVSNRYKARWGFDAILMDVGETEVRDLIDYYFTTVSANSHDLEWFFYNYDKLLVAKGKMEKDAVELARLRKESQRRTEEWRKRIGNN